jgi:peptidoglycan/xylan/chitin deacetylase (PgdA/CDA1 family)
LPAPELPRRRQYRVPGRLSRVGDVLILCYHAVSPDWGADLSATPEQLEEQLAHLRSRGYLGATFTQAVEAPPAERTLAVTFDDAYLSVFKLARPILAAAGVPGTLFVPTSFPDSHEPMAWPGIDHWLATPHRAELLPISWDQAGTLRDEGWEIGSHTRTHPHLTRLPDPALGEELTASREAIEQRLGGPCRSIAYPYGDVDQRVLAAAERAGYTTGAGLAGHFNRPRPLPWPRPLLWPRVGVWHNDDLARFRRQVSRPVRLLRQTPLWSGVEHVIQAARTAESRRHRG